MVIMSIRDEWIIARGFLDGCVENWRLLNQEDADEEYCETLR